MPRRGSGLAGGFAYQTEYTYLKKKHIINGARNLAYTRFKQTNCGPFLSKHAAEFENTRPMCPQYIVYKNEPQ